MKTSEPSLESIENEYWNIVKNADKSGNRLKIYYFIVTVYYGVDLNFNEFRYEYKNNDPWNLSNLPKNDGSLLKYVDTNIPGINSPWFYIGIQQFSFQL